MPNASETPRAASAARINQFIQDGFVRIKCASRSPIPNLIAAASAAANIR
jgi:hypothetical protein